jgi:hypothetical protein
VVAVVGFVKGPGAGKAGRLEKAEGNAGGVRVSIDPEGRLRPEGERRVRRYSLFTLRRHLDHVVAPGWDELLAGQSKTYDENGFYR